MTNRVNIERFWLVGWCIGCLQTGVKQAVKMKGSHLVTGPLWLKANHPGWVLYNKLRPPTPLFSCATLSHNVPFASPRQHDHDTNWSSGGKIHKNKITQEDENTNTEGTLRKS